MPVASGCEFCEKKPAPAGVRMYVDRSEFFRTASEITRERVASICMPRHVAKKETLFLEGQSGETVYLCGTAAVQLYKTDAQGKPIVVRVVGEAEMFAEVILFEQQKYPVNAEIIKSGTLFSISRRDFMALMDDAQFRECLFGDLMRKQRYLAEKIRQLASCDVEQRFFLFLHEHYGETETFAVKFSKKNIADAIGTTPESISRMLQRFKNDGVLEWEGENVTLRKGFWKDWFVS